jgi:hypothetical protein
MSEPTLEQVKELAKRLTPEERKQFFNFLADLPDSGIQTGSIDPPSPLLSPEDKQKVEAMADTDQTVIVYTETCASIFLRGRPMFQVFFYPENFRQSRMEIYFRNAAPPRERVVEEVREIIRLHENRELPEEAAIEAAKKADAEVYEAHMQGLANGLSARLGHLVYILYEGGLKVVEIANVNHFADYSEQPRKTLDEVVRELEPFWRHIKAHMNLTPGGRQNIKHTWRMRDYACLSVHYDRLKPIWREAKRIAKEAQNSKERTRQKRWKEEVAAIYQEQDLPADLIDLLEVPQATPPADLALTHAARKCIPEATYSLKVLKEKLRKFGSCFL